VEYDLLQHTPHPPHTEDHRYDPTTFCFVRRIDDAQRRQVLERSLFPSVSAVFEVPIQHDPGHYIKDGIGPRSLGTIRPQRIIKVIYEQSSEGQWKYRLGLVDGAETTYWLTITDLAWRYYCDHQRQTGRHVAQITAGLTTTLRDSTPYLRIGLARGWEKFPDRCYLQLTGVHTIPDYLDGKTFADFAPAI
jgi:hypothetical protein